jgi:hypothetical protein
MWQQSLKDVSSINVATCFHSYIVFYVNCFILFGVSNVGMYLIQICRYAFVPHMGHRVNYRQNDENNIIHPSLPSHSSHSFLGIKVEKTISILVSVI